MNWSDLPKYLELLPKDYTTGLLTGLALGLFFKWAARYLAIAAVFLLVFTAFRDAGIL